MTVLFAPALLGCEVCLLFCAACDRLGFLLSASDLRAETGELGGAVLFFLVCVLKLSCFLQAETQPQYQKLVTGGTGVRTCLHCTSGLTSAAWATTSPGNRLILVFLIRRNLSYLLTHLEASWMDIFCASRSTRNNPHIYSIKGLTS
jgi:hypothetical protein